MSNSTPTNNDQTLNWSNTGILLGTTAVCESHGALLTVASNADLLDDIKANTGAELEAFGVLVGLNAIGMMASAAHQADTSTLTAESQAMNIYRMW